MREDIYYISVPGDESPFAINIAGISYCDGTYRITRPHSDVLCMEYILDGEGTLFYDGKEYHPKKGDIYLLEAGKDHVYYSDSDAPWTKIWINAMGSLGNMLVQSYALSGQAVFDGTGLSKYFGKMVGICRQNKNAHATNTACALIFHEILQKLNAQKFTEVGHSDEARRLKSYIETHSDEALRIDTLSALIFKSRSQTIRLFKAEYGMTPYDYLLQVRFERAKSLLRGTSLLVKEIAFRTGFLDEHYFSDLFKRKCGMTPVEYRRKQ